VSSPRAEKEKFHAGAVERRQQAPCERTENTSPAPRGDEDKKSETNGQGGESQLRARAGMKKKGWNTADHKGGIGKEKQGEHPKTGLTSARREMFAHRRRVKRTKKKKGMLGSKWQGGQRPVRFRKYKGKQTKHRVEAES